MRKRQRVAGVGHHHIDDERRRQHDEEGGEQSSSNESGHLALNYLINSYLTDDRCPARRPGADRTG